MRSQVRTSRLLRRCYGRLRKMLDGGRDNLVTVREVAARFGVSTATVYELCARGVLAHFKLLNAIAPADAAAVIGRDRR